MSCALLGHSRLLTDPSLAGALAILVMLFFFLLLNRWARMVGCIFLVEDLLSHLLQLLPHVSIRRIVVLVNIDHDVVIVDRGRRGACDAPAAGTRRDQIFSSSTTSSGAWYATTSGQRLVTLSERAILYHAIRTWGNSGGELLGKGLAGCTEPSASPSYRYGLLNPSMISWR